MTTKNAVGRPQTKERPVNPEFLTLSVAQGDSIGEAGRRAVKLADHRGCKVRFVFDGIQIEVLPGQDAMDPVNMWIKCRKGISP